MLDFETNDVHGVEADGDFHRLKTDVHERLVSQINVGMLRALDPHVVRDEVRRGAEAICNDQLGLLSQADQERLIDEVVFEAIGLGPLETLMSDPTVSDILINGPHRVYVERNGRLEPTQVRFRDFDHLLSIVQRLVGRIGRRIDEASPIVDARLPDGSRLNAVMRPLALDDMLVSIRRFSQKPLLIWDLVGKRSATSEMIEFLTACVRAHLNIMISGGTGSGKTTLLNALSASIAPDERIVTIEDAAELRLQQPHVARMESRPKNLEGRGEVTPRALLCNALRMRPDRIIVGECRGAEAFDMLQAMNTGHHGSMTTIHANDTRDAVTRLEMLLGMAAPELPLTFIRRQITSAIDIVVQTMRVAGGARKITQISEITGMQGETVSMHDLFHFEQSDIDDSGNALGTFMAAGIQPQCLPRLRRAGVEISIDIFNRGFFASSIHSDDHSIHFSGDGFAVDPRDDHPADDGLLRSLR
ncbi:MAG: CpaF family protein [Pirellulales bacterium]